MQTDMTDELVITMTQEEFMEMLNAHWLFNRKYNDLHNIDYRVIDEKIIVRLRPQ